MIKPFFFCILIFISFCCRAQNDSDLPVLSEIVLYLLDAQNEEVLAPELTETLQHRIENPINLNSCNQADLQALGFLSEFQIKSIVDYVQHHAPLKSKYELQFALGLDPQILRWLYWFTTAEISNQIEKPHTKTLHGNTLFKTSRLLTLPKAYTDSAPKYLGDPFRLYSSSRFSAGRQWNVGFTAEKDAGEQISHGADFYSAYVQWEGKGLCKKIILGDYRAQFGQGLCVGSGFGNGFMQNSPLLLRKNDRGIFHYTPADENYFWRGVASTFEHLAWRYTAWGSFHSIDASLQNNDSLQLVSSIQSTGLHRTLSELTNRHQLAYSALGGNISYNCERFKLGVTLIHHQFSIGQSAGSKPYQLYNHTGSGLTNASLYYFIPNKYFDIWGELVIDDAYNPAMLHGISLIPVADFCFTIARRDYSVDYNSFMANGFGQYAGTRNEHGTSCIIEFSAAPTLKFKALYDMYKSPWLRYRISSPSTGSEQQCSVTWMPKSTQFTALFLYKRRTFEQDFLTEKMPTLQPIANQQFRIQASYNVTQNLTASNRIELNKLENSTQEPGIVLWQDIAVKHNNYTFDARFALFDTEWATRLYAVEDDLKQSFYSSLCYGQGVRWYAIIGWKSNNQRLLLQCKYSQTKQPEAQYLGSGYDQILGNVKSEIKALILYSF